MRFEAKWRFLGGWLFALAACTNDAPEGPLVERFEPDAMDRIGEAVVIVRGGAFQYRPQSDVSSGESEVDIRFEIRLESDSGDVIEIDEVRFVDTQSLEATIPAGLPPGMYSARVLGPYGQGPNTANVLKVFTDLDKDLVHDDADTCVDVDDDGIGRSGFDTSGCADVSPDSDDTDAMICLDTDDDGCDDCSGGTWTPAADGTDVDGDGFCAVGDCDDTPISGALCGNSCIDFFADVDGDGFGDASDTVTACVAPADYITNGGDCDDGNGNCDTDCTDADSDTFCANHDCDDDAATGGACSASCNTFFADADGDGFGNAASPVLGCAQPPGAVADNTDCADEPVADPACNGLPGSACHPGLFGSDTCDGANNDCDGGIDEDHVATATSCGVGACAGNAGVLSCVAGAVVDTCDPLAGAAADDATCDSSDDDCDGGVDESYMATGTSCGLGACAGNTGTLSCTSGVETDSCDPLAGSTTESPASSTCGDTIDNDCDGDTDLADLSCQIGNTPPVAAFGVSPSAGDTSTSFAGDATASFDLEDPFVALTIDWDWDGDGTFEQSGSTSNHTFATPGAHTVVVRVTDSGALPDYHTFIVSVANPGDLIVVTTGVDESDAGATPAVPGGTGLSLREAVTFAESEPGRQSILVPSGTVMQLTGVLPMSGATDGYDVVGDGAVLDGINVPATPGICMTLEGPSAISILGLEMLNCADTVISIVSGTGHQISRAFFHDNHAGINLASIAGRTLVGPNNTFELVESPIIARAPIDVIGNSISGAVRAIILNNGSDSSVVQNNVLLGNTEGIELKNNSGSTIANNTIQGSTSIGLNIAISGSAVTVLNNIISGGLADGIDASTSSFAALNFNNFFNNAGSDCTGCTLGPNSRTDDPLFINEGAEDFRLQPTSPLIDQGTVTGLDVNGAAPGNFNGASPDMGAHEAP